MSCGATRCASDGSLCAHIMPFIYIGFLSDSAVAGFYERLTENHYVICRQAGKTSRSTQSVSWITEHVYAGQQNSWSIATNETESVSFTIDAMCKTGRDGPARYVE